MRFVRRLVFAGNVTKSNIIQVGMDTDAGLASTKPYVIAMTNTMPASKSSTTPGR